MASETMAYRSFDLPTDRPIDRPTDLPTDRQTDRWYHMEVLLPKTKRYKTSSLISIDAKNLYQSVCFSLGVKASYTSMRKLHSLGIFLIINR